MPREGKFNLEYENKALFNSSKSVDAMGFMAMGIWRGDNLALRWPASALRWLHAHKGF